MLAQNIQTQSLQAQNVKGIFSMIAGKMSSQASQNNSFEKLFASTTSKTEISVKSTDATMQKQVTTEMKAQESCLDSSQEITGIQTDIKDENVAQVSKTEGTDAEFAEKVATLVNQVIQVIQEHLNLSDEQFESLLGQLNISQEELLDPNVLKEFYLLANQQSDAAILLTDESLLNDFKLLSDTVTALIQNSGMQKNDVIQKLEDPEFIELLNKAQNFIKQVNTEEQPNNDNTVTEEQQVSATVTKKNEETKIMDISFKTETQSNETKDTETNQKLTSTIMNDTTAEQFVNQLQNAAEQVDSLTGTDQLQTQIREIANQILEQVKVVVKPEMTSLEIQLTPEHLGKVNLTVIDQDGIMTAKFYTENQLTKEAIESNLVQFKEMLQEQGIKVDSIEVTVSEFSFNKDGQTEQNQENQQKGKRRFVMVDTEENNTVTDQIGLHFLKGGESTVNYMA